MYLKLIIGCMFSGKSSSLLSEIYRYKFKSILVINHILDKERHSDMSDGFIKTHNNKSHPAIMLNTLSELKTNSKYIELYNNSQIVLIDEGQFYSDIYDFINYELQHSNKKFIIAGLNADAYMQPFGDIIKLIPLADDIEKLSAFCNYCESKASFTKKINNNNTSQILIGNEDTYQPVCRKHFFHDTNIKMVPQKGPWGPYLIDGKWIDNEGAQALATYSINTDRSKHYHKN